MRRFQLFDEFAGPVTGEQVLKHGRHNQKDHAGKRGSSDLPEGWSETSREDLIQRAMAGARADWAANTPEARLREIIEPNFDGVRQYNGPNNTTVNVVLPKGEDVDAATMSNVMSTVNKLQEQNPVDGLRVEFNDSPFRDEGAEDGVKAFVIRGEKTIHARPQYAQGANLIDREEGFLMPSSKSVSEVEYIVTHEYGHVVDRRNRFDLDDDYINLRNGLPPSQQGGQTLLLDSLSSYGRSNNFENYAEAYAEWSITNGATTNAASNYFSDKYNWGANMSKAVDDEVERVVIFDTFDETEPPSVRVKPQAEVIKFAPGLVPVIKFNPRQPRAKDGRWTKGGAAWGGDFAGSPFEPSPAEIDYREQMANIDYIMGRSAFPPGYSYEGLPPPTVTLRQLGREQVTKVRRKIKAWKEARERRYLENLSDEKRAKLIAANRARVDAKRAARGLPPVVYKSMDPVLPLLYDVFRDVVDDPFVWAALIQDERPLSQIDGDLGAILDDMLDAVAPAETVIKFAPGLRPVLKHGSHNQKDHAGKSGRSGDQKLRNQDDPMNPETAWVHEATWYHGTSRPGLEVIDARVGGARYPDMGRGYALSAYNFATSDREKAAEYARESAKQDAEAGVEGVRPVVYRVVPTSDYFDPDPHSGPGGWGDGPENMDVARDLWEGGGEVSLRFHDEMDIAGAFDADTGEDLSVVKMLNMLKHLSGKHDQKTHGSGGGTSGPDSAPGGGQFSAWGDREGELRVAARMGPSREMLDRALYPEVSDVDPAEVRARVAEEYNFYIEPSVDYLVSRSGRPREEHYEEMLDEMVRVHGDKIARRIVAEKIAEDFDSLEAIETMNEVYGTSHTGVNRDGFEVTIQANVDSVYPPQYNGDALKVEGTLMTEDGLSVGRFVRHFQQDGEGGVKVSHELLEIDDDDYQGAGFSKVFNRNAENYYISHGIDRIDVHAALDGGGYTWASSGFDFDTNPGNLAKSRENLNFRMDQYETNFNVPRVVRNQMDSLRSRILLDPLNENFPTPKEFADIGRLPGAESWPGKVMMRGSNWYGTKILRPEGARKSRTQQWNEARAAAAEANREKFAQPPPQGT